MVDFSARQLRAALLVATHHNFSRAADALGITASGLSLLIKELEAHVGFRLFDRTTRSVGVTPHGAELLAVVRRTMSELDGVMSRLGRSAKAAGDTLSVGAGLLAAANILPDALAEFGRQRPGLRVELFDGDPLAIMQKVRAGVLDIGLGFFKPAAGVRRTLFFRFTLMAIRADRTLTPRRTTMTWSALENEALVLQAKPAPLRGLIDQHLGRAGVKPARISDVNRLETVIAMVEASSGTGIVPSFALPVCRRRNVGMIKLIKPEVPVEFYQIRNRGRALPPAAEEFAAFLQGYIARWAGRAGIP